MAEKKINWTRQQLQAITARGSDILVSASAGTGKTAVLSGRCVDIVSDIGICPDIGSIVVLTFTEAAAEQMKNRIAAQLKDAFLQKSDSHLRYQLILLQGPTSARYTPSANELSRSISISSASTPHLESSTKTSKDS